jgi:hypothetical protein
MTDDEFLDQAEADIRRSDKRVVLEIFAIGKKLAEIKARVGYGRYGVFIRDRLRFSERSAQQYVQSYEFLKSAHCADFESLHIDTSAIRLLARPTTPNEVRVEALARAAKPQGISYSEVKKLIAKTEAPVIASDETPEKEVSRPRAADESFVLESGSSQTDEPIAEPNGGAKAITEPVHGEIHFEHHGEIPPSKAQIAAPETINKGAAAPAPLTEKAVAEAKERSDPLVDTELASRATEASQALFNCVAAIKLTPSEFIAGETEVADLAQTDHAIRELQRWCAKYIELRAKKINSEQPPPSLDPLPLRERPRLVPARQDPSNRRPDCRAPGGICRYAKCSQEDRCVAIPRPNPDQKPAIVHGTA